MQRAFKTELDPNNKQLTMLKKHAGVARFAYNWGLDICQKALQNKELVPSAIDLHKQIVVLKNEKPWLREVSKCSPQESLRNLENSFKNFFRNRKQKKPGKKGFPKFKSKHNSKESFRLTGTIKILENHIQLPVLGIIKLKEIGYLPDNARIINATVSEHAGRWFVSILVGQVEPEKQIKQENIVGVDLGIKSLAVCSDGRVFENHKALRNNLDKLKMFGRQVSRRHKSSKNRIKAKDKLAKQHYKISCIRKDSLHKVSSELTKTKSVIVLEDLNVSGMLKNRKLSRVIADVGWSELRRQLEYKGNWYGCEIVVADRFYPSSQLCSFCGARKADLRLSDREYTCKECGNVIDRDLNAARNLASLAKPTNTASSAGINAFGEESSGLTAMSCETGLVELGIKQEIFTDFHRF